MKILEKLRLSNFINRRNDRDDGFTMLEMVIVLAIMAILMLLVSVGLEGYNNAADRIERNEVAESSYYAVQSYLAMAKRQGELEEFTNSVKIYNLSTYGDEMVLTNAQNKMVIESNYDGSDFDNYFANDYEVQHQNSEFVCMRLDAGDADIREANPLYTILFAALKDQDVMEHSFLVEFDSNSGIVRSVFYSKDTVSLDYHFLQEESSRQENESDVIDRNTASLDKKRQGYCGVLETNGYRDNFALAEPQNFMLVNNDRLYLTWDEANAVEPDFMSGKYQLDNLIYEVNLYNQDSELVATYELPRRDLTKDLTGTKAGILNYVDDMGEEIHDEGNTMTTRAGYTELTMEEAEDGIAGEKYYVLLECLDHTFLDNGYDFSADDEIYATLSLYYKENTVNAEKKVGFEETVVSNVESVYYADVLEDDGDKEFTLAYSRHLWNVRNGLYTEDYRLVADIDWGNIEERARDIAFTSTVFQDEAVHGLTHGLQGTFKGTKESPDGVAEVYRNATCHEIKGIHIYEDANIQVGLFAFNQGEISDVILSDFVVEGARHVGSMTGINEGTIRNVCVLDAEVNGNSELGGISGSNKGNIRDSVVESTVEVVLPAGNDKISTGTIGRYIGGAVGYQYATGTMNNISSGVLINETNGKALIENWEGKGGSASVTAKRVASDVTGIRAVGGIVGEIEYNAGEFKNLYNYAKLNATYVDVAERTARGDVESHMYQLFGGIVGKLETTNTLSNCENHAIVALDFKKNGVVCDADEIYTYITTEGTNGELFNNPRYIGGIAGYSIGTVVDCTTQYDVHGGLDEELAEYCKVVNREEGVYVGSGVGGIVGMNAGTLLYTDAYSAGNVNVVVRGLKSVGGLVGQAISGSVQNNSTELKVEGVVTSQLEHAGGVVAFASGGTIGGTYTNNGYVMGENAGGIAGYLGETITLANSNNTGVIYGRGNASTTRGYVGGVIGYNKGTANNCTNAGTVTVSHLLNAIPDTAPDYDETYADIGGVVGYNIGNVVNCHSRLNAEGTNYIVGNNCCYTGGLVGRNTHNGSDRFGTIQTATLETVDIPIIIGAIQQDTVNMKTGGVVGVADGTLMLQNFCYAGDINVKVAINNTHVGTGGIMGGLANSQELAGCIFRGSVVSKSAGTGGMIGHMAGGVITGTNVVSEQATIEGNYFTGGVVGYHIVSSPDSAVEIMETRAQVIGQYDVGGCVGHVRYSNTFSLSNRKNYGKVIGGKYAGGVVGGYGISGVVDAVEVQNHGDIEGYAVVGGLIGRITTEDKYKDIEFQFDKLLNDGKITGNTANAAQIGGLIGLNEAVIKLTECENRGSLGPKDENCAVTTAGGMIGWDTKVSTMVNCTNYGAISGDKNIAGFIGYANAAGTKIKLERCINQKDSQIIAKTESASGFVGKCEGTKATNHDLIVIDCENYAKIDSPKNVGSILGYGSYVVVQAEECNNYGEIGVYAADKWTSVDVGGMIGILKGSADMNQGVVRNSTQNANIYSVGSSGETGGIIGKSEVPMLIENCSFGTQTQKYNIEAVAGSRRIGGAVGCNNATLQINQYVSNADINGKGRIYEIGGLVGESAGTLQVGVKDDATTYSTVYGNIDSTGKIQDTGGVVGLVSKADYSIYGATNYGFIGKNSSEVTYTGGIVGNSKLNTYEKEAYGVIDNCTQLGQIYKVSNHVGGMLGTNDYYDTTILNCNNGALDVTDSGKIWITVSTQPGTVGGVVGGSEGANEADAFERNLIIEKSNNYGDIFFQLSAGNVSNVGGIVGKSTHDTVIGAEGNIEKACINYGNVYGENGSSASNVGGILGLVNGENYKIYEAENKGDIGQNCAEVSYAGGIVGRNFLNTITKEATGTITNCTQLGQIYNASTHVGGILGGDDYYSVTIKGCNNGSADVVNSGKIHVQVSSSSNRIGGLVGGVSKFEDEDTYKRQLTVESSNNYGEIYLYKSAGLVRQVGGIVGYSVHYTTIGGEEATTLCTNHAKIHGESGSKVSYVGGILGMSSSTYADKVTTLITHAKNNASIGEGMEAVVNAGGIVGRLGQSGALVGCTNRGSLYSLSESETTNYGSGGMVGYADGGEIIIQSCVNGDAASGEVGSLVTGGEIERIGGLVGGAGREDGQLAVVYAMGCFNYADLNITHNANYIGGIYGHQYPGGYGMLMSTENHGDIVADGVNVTHVGGLLGSAMGIQTAIGMDDNKGGTYAAYNCSNYGNLRFENGSTGRYVGGIAGKISNAYICGATNEGDIIPDDTGSYVAVVGGIAGYLVDETVVQDTKQMGCIKHAVFDGLQVTAGGIVGLLEGNATLKRNNNGSADARTAGDDAGFISMDLSVENETPKNAGGIVGRSTATLTVQNCKNYGDVTGSAGVEMKNIGGLVGRAENALKVYDSENYGHLAKEDSGGIINAGGIVGYLETADGVTSELARCNQKSNIYNSKGEVSGAGAGGIAGFVKSETVIDSCTSDGNITMVADSIRNGGIIGANFKKTTIKNCTNSGTLTGSGIASCVGGVTGLGGENITVENCINNGVITATEIHAAGGIIGQLEHEGAENIITGCTQNGTISNVKGNGNAAGAGGIVGFNRARTSISNCYNGQEESSTGSISALNGAERIGGLVGAATVHPLTITDSISYGTINCDGSIQFSGGVLGLNQSPVTMTGVANKGDILIAGNGLYMGGILGKSEAAVSMTSCDNEGALTSSNELKFSGGIIGNLVGSVETIFYDVENKGNISMAGFAENIGGMIGEFYWPRTVTIDKCTNYGSFNVTGTLINLGGIIGKSSGQASIGMLEEEESFGAKNYGEIVTSGGTIHQAGGIVGYMERGANVNHCENYGNIHVGSGGAVYNAGGIIGGTLGEESIELFACANYAAVNQGNPAGGIIGAAKSYETIENCYSVGEVRGVFGGALIGNKDTGEKLVLIDSYARKDLTDTNTLITNIGDWTTLAGCTYRGGNNGEFSKSVYDTLCTVYGVENQWNDTDMAVNVRYLMSNYVAAN